MKSIIRANARLTRIALLILAACVLCAGAAQAQMPAHLWSQRFGDASNQNGISVAVDPAGDVYLTGTFQGSIDFGGGALTSLGSDDIFLAKFSPTGAYVWSKRFGDAASQTGKAVATDPSGNVYVAGEFFGSVNFGGGILTSAGAQDVFLVKFDANGVHQWSKGFGDVGGQFAADVATDAAGDVFLSGFGAGTMDFGGGGLVLSSDTFLAKFTTGGAHLWSQKFGDAGNSQICKSMATDASGSVYITGGYLGSVSFGGSTLNSAGSGDVYIAKFDGAGVHQWSQGFGDVGNDAGEGVATDPSGNVYLVGEFQQTINFGGSTLTSAGSYDVFVAKFTTAGVHQWSYGFGDAGNQQGRDAAATASGVYILGEFFGNVNFGGGNLTGVGLENIFLAKFSPSGVYHGSQQYGDINGQYAKSVVTDAAGNAVITGYFGGSVNFGGATLTSQGAQDVYLAKFGPAATAAGDLPTTALTISASPNPFNPTTVVRYLLPQSGHATLRIFDARGARVATLVDTGQSAGEHTLTWDGKDATGNRASSGVYFARLESGGQKTTLRLVLVK